MSASPKKDSPVLSYVLLIITVFSSAVNTGLNVLYFVAIFMTVFLIFAYANGKGNIKGIEIERHLGRECREKEKIFVDYRIKNKRRAYYLQIEDEKFSFLESEDYAYAGFLEAGPETKEVRSFYKFSIPGIFFLKTLKLRSAFPAGIIEFERTVNTENEIVVLPETFDFSKVPEDLFMNLSENEYFKVKIGTGENIWGVRQYEYGDRMRDIDWKLSARRDDLMVKIREQPLGKRIWLMPVLKDNERTDGNADVIRMCSSLAKNRLNQGCLVGLLMGGRVVFPHGGGEQFLVLSKELCYIWNENASIPAAGRMLSALSPGDVAVLVTNGDPVGLSPILKDMRNSFINPVTIHIGDDVRKMKEYADHFINIDERFYFAQKGRMGDVFENTFS